MDALDGNAIGGLLQEIFGTEMTVAVATCAHCGTAAEVAQCVVYLDGPGTVVRCRTCGQVMAVIIRRAEMNCVDMRGVARLENPAAV